MVDFPVYRDALCCDKNPGLCIHSFAEKNIANRNQNFIFANIADFNKCPTILQ